MPNLAQLLTRSAAANPDRVTVFEGVPTMYAAMLNHPRADETEASTLEVCVSGGAAMPVEVMRAFEQKFGCQILEGYGLSETSPVASFNRRDRERKPGSIGIPVDGVEMRVIDDDGNEVPPGEVGEIAIRGHNVMKGYWRREEATAEAIDAEGWFVTAEPLYCKAEIPEGAATNTSGTSDGGRSRWIDSCSRPSSIRPTTSRRVRGRDRRLTTRVGNRGRSGSRACR